MFRIIGWGTGQGARGFGGNSRNIRRENAREASHSRKRLKKVGKKICGGNSGGYGFEALPQGGGGAPE